MLNKVCIILFSMIAIISNAFGDTTNVISDSAIKPFSPPNNGPLGIDNMTGVALYGAAILFAVLVMALWRKNINSRVTKTNG